MTKIRSELLKVDDDEQFEKCLDLQLDVYDQFTANRQHIVLSREEMEKQIREQRDRRRGFLERGDSFHEDEDMADDTDTTTTTGDQRDVTGATESASDVPQVSTHNTATGQPTGPPSTI